MKKIVTVFLIVFGVLIFVACGQKNDLNEGTSSKEVEAENERLKSEIEDLKRQLEKSKNQSNAATAQQEESKPKWNTSDVNIETNGNLNLAVELLSSSDKLKDGEEIEPSKVYKAPWDYYGKPVKFTGYVNLVEDFPPDGNLPFRSEIVILTGDDTIVDILSLVPSGDIKNGDLVTIVGMPIGRAEVENAVGGSFTHLVVVTNNIE